MKCSKSIAKARDASRLCPTSEMQILSVYLPTLCAPYIIRFSFFILSVSFSHSDTFRSEGFRNFDADCDAFFVFGFAFSGVLSERGNCPQTEVRKGTRRAGEDERGTVSENEPNAPEN